VAWRKLDRARSRRLLERAWQVSEGIQDVRERGIQQEDIVLLGMASLDLDRAKALAKQIRDSDSRPARSQMIGSVASADPRKGVALLNTIQSRPVRESTTFDAADDLLDDSPQQAVWLIWNVNGIDKEEGIGTLIRYIAHRDPDAAKGMLRFLHSTFSRETA